MISALAGKRILLVEDEFIIAAMAEDILTELGAVVVGPASTIGAALDLAGSQAIDAAVLDVNMAGKRVDPVAELLTARRIPVVFATGYGAGGLAGGRAPVLEKPYSEDRLIDALTRALQAPPHAD